MGRVFGYVSVVVQFKASVILVEESASGKRTLMRFGVHLLGADPSTG
jgi:hypothetical protein